MSARGLVYGGIPVPYTVSWSGEQKVFLSRCPYAQALAMSSPQCPGVGKPSFGSPHPNRQREAIAIGLCDLCGRSIKTTTKVSLSQARPVAHAASFGDILQVEPLLHRQCAAVCMEHCPSLRRQRRDGVLNIRQVFAYQVQFAIYSEEGVFQACGERQRAIAHAKVHLLKWRDRDLDWLGQHTKETDQP